MSEDPWLDETWWLIRAYLLELWRTVITAFAQVGRVEYARVEQVLTLTAALRIPPSVSAHSVAPPRTGCGDD